MNNAAINMTTKLNSPIDGRPANKTQNNTEEFKKVLDKTSIKNEDTLKNKKTALAQEKKSVEEENSVQDKSPKEVADSKTKEVEAENKASLEEVPEKPQEDGENQESVLMSLIYKLIMGQVSYDQIKEKLGENPENAGEISNKAITDIINLIRQQIKLSEGEIQELNGELQKQMNSLLQGASQENNSFLDIIKQVINKATAAGDNMSLQLVTADGNKDLDLQEKIIDSLKSKLLNNAEVEKDENITVLSQKDNFSNNLSQDTSNMKKESEFENKFLKDLSEGNKNELDSKLTKVVSFMNGFNKINTTNEIPKVVESITINRETLVNDIIKSVKFMEQNNMKEMTVKVMPRELGEVIIKLTMENGLMKASVTATNKEAYNILNSNLQEINNKISNTEIKIQNFSIDIYNGDTTFFSRENSKEDGRQYNRGNGKGTSTLGEVQEGSLDNSTPIEQSNLNAFV